MIALVVIAGIVLSVTENWHINDAMYFSALSVTTVGYSQQVRNNLFFFFFFLKKKIYYLNF